MNSYFFKNGCSKRNDSFSEKGKPIWIGGSRIFNDLKQEVAGRLIEKQKRFASKEREQALNVLKTAIHDKQLGFGKEYIRQTIGAFLSGFLFM